MSKKVSAFLDFSSRTTYINTYIDMKQCGYSECKEIVKLMG